MVGVILLLVGFIFVICRLFAHAPVKKRETKSSKSDQNLIFLLNGNINSVKLAMRMKKTLRERPVNFLVL